MAGIILICGLNGAGKTTLAKALAEKISYRFVDKEDLYFRKEDNPHYPYAKARSAEEAIGLLSRIVDEEENIVLASVTGESSDAILARLRCAVCLQAPRALRLKRVHDRSAQRFGDKIREGGAYYQEVRAFHEFVAARDESLVENWLSTLSCPVLRIDGTQPVDVSVRQITEWLGGLL